MRTLLPWPLILTWVAILLPSLTHANTPPPDPFALLGFVENRGQAPQAVFAYTPTRAGLSQVTRDGRLIHQIRTGDGRPVRLEERFSRKPLRPRSLSKAPARVSFFTGAKPKAWHRDIPTHGAIELGEAVPGVRVQLLARPGNLEKRFHLAPGTNPDAVSIRLQGARSLSVEQDGRLRVETAEGTVHFTAPVAWQTRPGGGRDPVEVAYVVRGERYGFRLGPHDPKREVVIDPLLGTALLRESAASVDDLTVDPFGDVFIVGSTHGSNLQALASGTYDTTADGGNTGETAGFIAKFSRDLTQLLALTFLGGARDNVDKGAYDAYTHLTAVATNTQGDVFVAGYTNTEDFPIVNPTSKSTIALRKSFGGYEFVVARLSNDLDQLTASAYLSGKGNEGSNGLSFSRDSYVGQVDIALAPDEQTLYLAGVSSSTDLPTNQGSAGDANPPAYMPVDPHPGQYGYDCYLAQLPLDFTTVNATWVGNNNGNWAMSCYLVGTDSIGSVFVAGYGRGQFEDGITGHATSQNPGDNVYGDLQDTIVVRFSADLRTLHNGTFLGASNGCFECDNPDRPWDMVITDAAEVILVGETPIPPADKPELTLFPTTPGALITQTSSAPSNINVGYVARLDNSLQLQAATLLHLCPTGDQGMPDCEQGGSGYATAVDFYSYYDDNGQTRRDIFVAYSQFGLTVGRPGAYMSLPWGMKFLGNLSLHRLSEDLSSRLAATDFWTTADFPHLAFSETYFDGSRNQSDPRIYAGFSAYYALQHPQGFAGPDGTDVFGVPFRDAGPFIIALDPNLSAGDAPSLVFASTESVDLGYLPGSTTTAPAALPALVNNSNDTLTLYTGYFEDNGLGASWGFTNGVNSCLPQPFILNPGASCVIYVNAMSSVTDPVTFRARLHLVTNDPNGAILTSPDITVRATPVLLTYSGSYISAIDYLGEGLDFGIADVGNSEQRTVTARSRIDGLQFGQITLGTSGPFSVDTDTCSGQTLNEGNRCTVTVRYQPVSAGAHEAILDFADTIGGTWVALRLSGSGQAGSGGSAGPGGGNTSGSGGSAGSGGGGGNTGGPGGNGGGGGLFGAIGPLPLLAGLILTILARRRRRP